MYTWCEASRAHAACGRRSALRGADWYADAQSLGWRRIAAFGVDYGLVFAYLGFLTLVGVLGRIVGALPTDIATPTARVVAQLVIFAVLAVPVTAWFAGWEAIPAERPRASGC